MDVKISWESEECKNLYFEEYKSFYFVQRNPCLNLDTQIPNWEDHVNSELEPICRPLSLSLCEERLVVSTEFSFRDWK